jgi:hypothetical protein
MRLQSPVGAKLSTAIRMSLQTKACSGSLGPCGEKHLTGYQFYHNYFREHEGLNRKTPAEIAGIKIDGENKWITVIQNASRLQKS